MKHKYLIAFSPLFWVLVVFPVVWWFVPYNAAYVLMLIMFVLSGAYCTRLLAGRLRTVPALITGIVLALTIMLWVASANVFDGYIF